MNFNRFIWWLNSEFDRTWFTSFDVESRLNLNRQHIYADLHKCWKMNLLSREKIKGHRYRYQVSNWGRRYSEYGEIHSQDMIYLKLLNYIIEHGDIHDKRWARSVIVPHLMQKYLRGKKKQDIVPRADLIEVKLYPIDAIFSKNGRRFPHFDSKIDGAGRLEFKLHKATIALIEKLLSQIA